MNCSCDENTILCTEGTTLNLYFNFNENISVFDKAVFVVRKNADSIPVITKTITELKEDSAEVELSPTDTSKFVFDNNKNQATYIWGLDLLGGTTRINVFPKTGESAPLFVVYKHIAEE